MFSLIYMTESGARKRYELKPGDTLLGRAATCDLVLDHPSVSRWHARIRVTEDSCQLTDVGSRHGTYRNGELVTEVKLEDNDRLLLGQFLVEVQETVEGGIALNDLHATLDPKATISRPVHTRLPNQPTGLRVVDAGRLLELISEIAGTLVQSKPLVEVLNKVVDITFETIPAERAFLMLNDDRTNELVPRVVRCRDGSTPAGASISKTIARKVMTERVALAAANAQVDPRLGQAESIQVHKIRSFMCAPLWNQNAVIGILYVDNPVSRRFVSADLDLFTALSNYAAVAIEQARLAARLQDETRRRERLQRYHSPSVVQRILEGGQDGDAPFIAQERDLSVLFADIVGFTSISQHLAPSEVARLLNTYFRAMTEIIFEHEGTLDKFIGDAILAVFGAPLEQPDHAMRCVRAAQAMRQRLETLNQEQPQTLRIRIAINSGLALVGDIGSPKRREFTVLGDVVNVASRVESSVAKPDQIVITSSTWDRIKGCVEARSLGTAELRGRQGAIEVLEIVG
jgi:adenylate cyclase